MTHSFHHTPGPIAPHRHSPWHQFNLLPDKPDARDIMLSAPAPGKISYPSKMSLRAGFKAIKDQGNINGCTGYAAASVMLYVAQQQGIQVEDFSEFYTYYNGRLLENGQNLDQGEYIRDTIKALGMYGVCENRLWPDDPTKVLVKPSLEAYNNGALYKATAYRRVNQTQNDIVAAIVSGFPIIIGIAVYESFESTQMATTGVGVMPKPGEKLYGGHAIVLTGYDLSGPQPVVEIRNQWGATWGDQGYATLPMQFLLDPTLTTDLWVIIKVS